MSKELVERLRLESVERAKEPDWFNEEFSQAIVEAADEIERLNGIIEDMGVVLQGALDKMEFTWQELDAQHGLCRNVLDVTDGMLWKEIVAARAALSKAHKVKE